VQAEEDLAGRARFGVPTTCAAVVHITGFNASIRRNRDAGGGRQSRPSGLGPTSPTNALTFCFHGAFEAWTFPR
jgi:hypothetical protein